MTETTPRCKVIVCGGRNFKDYERVQRELDFFHGEYGFAEVIHGCANGADTAAGRWAKEEGIKVREFPADWNKHGKAAGPIRNKQMLAEGQPDLVIAFPGGKGTANMISQAKAAGLRVEEIT